MKIYFLIRSYRIDGLQFQFLKADETNFRITHVKGQVIDSTDSSPLAYATIRIKGSDIAMQTKDNGFFEMDVPYDTCTLEITYVGYRTKEIRLNPNLINGAITIRAFKRK